MRLTAPSIAGAAVALAVALAWYLLHAEPPFAFPGGRRFQFTDPSGNELGVWSQAGAAH